MILQELLLSSLFGSKYMFALNFNEASNWILSGEYAQGFHFSALNSPFEIFSGNEECQWTWTVLSVSDIHTNTNSF